MATEDSKEAPKVFGTVGEPTMEYTNYDVLVDSPEEDVYSLEHYTDHVGNSRFGVLTDMYREAYELGESKGVEEECQSIIERIYEVQCHKSIASMENRGRFLIRVEKPDHVTDGGPDDEWWLALDEQRGKDVVRHALQTKPLEEEDLALSLPGGDVYDDRKRGRTRSLLRRSASESTMMEDKKKTTRVGVTEVPVSRNVASKDLANHRPEFSPTPVLSNSAAMQMQRALKAGRSTSEGVLRTDRSKSPVRSRSPIRAKSPIRSKSPTPPINLNIPPRTTPAPAPLFGAGTTPTFPTSSFISSHQGLDVVFAPNGKQLSTKPNIVGNNRLQVMLTLQTLSFPNKSPAEQDKSVADLIKAVKVYWGGRLLIEHGSSFIEMTPEQATAAMKSLLSGPGGRGGIFKGTSAVDGVTTDLLEHITAPTPNFMHKTSEEILKSGMNHPGAQTMQSTAIKSLLQRKAKRGLAKSLGKDIVGKTGVEQGEVNFVKLNKLDSS